MRPKQKAAYEELSAKLQVDELRLDEEIIELPRLLQEVNEYVAAAVYMRDQVQNEIKIAMAEESRDIRVHSEASAKRLTEASIEVGVVLSPRIKAMQTRFEDVKYDLARWQALSEAVRNKGYALKNVAELIIAGYVTPDTIIKRRRERTRPKLDINNGDT
jgi:hypothetical protein